jgi:hypothetical protein
MGFGSDAASASNLSKFGMISGIGGAVTSGVGSYFSALGQKNSLNFQAQMDQANALHAADAGTTQAANVLQKGAQIMGEQRASFAANGVDINDGSAAETIASTDVDRHIDANTTINNAMQEAFGYRASAQLKTAAASAISPVTAGLTSLLTSASSVAGQWAYGKLGVAGRGGGGRG